MMIISFGSKWNKNQVFFYYPCTITINFVKKCVVDSYLNKVVHAVFLISVIQIRQEPMGSRILFFELDFNANLARRT